MEFADDTRNVLSYLEEASEQGLRKPEDLGVLFEMTARREAAEEMGGLLFHGSALYRLYHTLRKSGSNAEGYEKLEREFRERAEEVRELIAKALVEAEEEMVDRFETTYYQMTQGALRNLIDLAHDLDVAKRVQNDQKN